MSMLSYIDMIINNKNGMNSQDILWSYSAKKTHTLDGLGKSPGVCGKDPSYWWAPECAGCRIKPDPEIGRSRASSC